MNRFEEKIPIILVLMSSNTQLTFCTQRMKKKMFNSKRTEKLKQKEKESVDEFSGKCYCSIPSSS